jgi:hypothetical protein
MFANSDFTLSEKAYEREVSWVNSRSHAYVHTVGVNMFAGSSASYDGIFNNNKKLSGASLPVTKRRCLPS